METEENLLTTKKIKLTDEQIGKLQRKLNEAIRRIRTGAIDYDDTVDVMQKIIIEGKARLHLGTIEGTHGIIAIERFINCYAAPLIPPGMTIEEHKKGGLWKWDLKRLTLYLSEEQKKGSIVGYDLRKELAGKPVFNANVLDCLLALPELIPESWKGKAIFFWGTIYRTNGRLYVPYLSCNGSHWHRDYFWLGNDLGSGNPAALAS